MAAELTQERLRELLDYDPETGVFINRVNRSGRRGRAGDVAGCVQKPDGYRVIGIDRRLYVAHRLAWLYVHGRWPPDQIDHINGDKLDNRLSNLRQSSQAENMRNCARRVDNTSGHKGVYYFPRNPKKPWMAGIGIDGKQKHLGYFASRDEAAVAYRKAALAYHGAFARFE